MPATGEAQQRAHDPAAAALRARFEQGLALHREGRLAEAEPIYREVLQQQPNDAPALHMLGIIAYQCQKFEPAAALIGKAVALRPDFADAYNDLGLAQSSMNRQSEALSSFEQAVALKPDFAEAHSNRGSMLKALMRPEEALAALDRAIALKPDHAMAHNNRSNVLLDLDRPADALASCDRAIACEPDLAIAHYNRGVALQDLDRHTEALASFERAIELDPHFTEAFWNRCLCLLLLGRFEQGWPEYEWRKRRLEPVADRRFPEPLWRGEDLAGKTVFVWWEQGFGDTLQFFRYVPLVAARAVRVIFSVQQPLSGLLRQIGPGIEFAGPEDIPGNFDYHCPLLSLPHAFGTTLETIPAQQQFLKADENARRAWAARLPPKTRPRIGLAWSGRTDHKDDRDRSIELAKLLPILDEGADWFCLQKEVREHDLATLRQSGRIAFFGDELQTFDDTAALLDAMDLVISADTSVAHLAGAMGKPVWILLPFNPEWRWLLNREDSPWYPSARLFRQPVLGDWAAVIDRVGSELRLLGNNAGHR